MPFTELERQVADLQARMRRLESGFLLDVGAMAKIGAERRIDANGSITVDDSTYFVIIGEGSGTITTLRNIYGGILGQIIVLSIKSPTTGYVFVDDVSGGDIDLVQDHILSHNSSKLWLMWDGSNWKELGFTIDSSIFTALEIKGGGDGNTVIANGEYDQVVLFGRYRVPSWRLISDVSGSITLDVQWCSFSGYPGSLISMVGGGTAPAISSAQLANGNTDDWDYDGTDTTHIILGPAVLKVLANGAATSIKRCWVALNIVQG